MLDRLRTLLGTIRALTEIDTLTDRDLADIGLSRAEVAELVAIPAAVEARVLRMAAVHGLTAEDLAADRPTRIEALETCAHCGAARTCARAFDAGPVTPANAGWCPNGALYRDLSGRAH